MSDEEFVAPQPPRSLDLIKTERGKKDMRRWLKYELYERPLREALERTPDHPPARREEDDDLEDEEIEDPFTDELSAAMHGKPEILTWALGLRTATVAEQEWLLSQLSRSKRDKPQEQSAKVRGTKIKRALVVRAAEKADRIKELWRKTYKRKNVPHDEAVAFAVERCLINNFDRSHPLHDDMCEAVSQEIKKAQDRRLR